MTAAADLPELPPLPSELHVPDDLSELTNPDPDLAMVLTPLAEPEPLAGICALQNIGADVFPSDAGAVAILPTLSQGALDQAAAAISGLLGEHPIYLLTRAQGQIESLGYRSGVPDPLVRPLVLARLPEVIEDLLVGVTQREHLPGLLPASNGRIAAAKWFSRAARTRSASSEPGPSHE